MISGITGQTNAHCQGDASIVNGGSTKEKTKVNAHAQPLLKKPAYGVDLLSVNSVVKEMMAGKTVTTSR